MDDLLRRESMALFKGEKEFLLSLYHEKDETKLLYRLTIATEDQIKCLIVLLYFTFKKEIPLKRSLFKSMPLQLLKYLKSKLDHPFATIHNEGREYHMLILFKVHKFLPQLVAGILKDVPKIEEI